MLVFSRKSGDQIHIDDNIVITVLRITSSKVQIGVEAPLCNRILRSELVSRAAEPGRETLAGTTRAQDGLASVF